MFSLCPPLQGGYPHPAKGGGVPKVQTWGYLSVGPDRGVPHPRSGWGYPIPDMDMGVPPSKIRMGGYPIKDWMGYPPLGTGRGTLPSRTGWGTTHPPTPHPGLDRASHTIKRHISIASTCYAAGGMPLAFTQEYFLVSNCFNIPLKAGLIFQIVIGPKLANWPKESSMKKSGNPTSDSMITYGIKKAPKTSFAYFCILPIRKYNSVPN